MTKHFKNNKKGYKILTPDGWQDFAGIAQTGVQDIIRLEFGEKIWIECTPDHGLYNFWNMLTPAEKWCIGDKVSSTHGPLELTNIIKKEKSMTYDVIDVDNGNKFYANGVVSSNCEFISFDETLISPIFINEEFPSMGVDPAFSVGAVRWYKKIEPNKTYAIAMDPSMGTGGDNAAIQIWQFPEFIQVGEWFHNKTPIPQQVRLMHSILKYIEEEMIEGGQQRSEPEIYWTIENNSIGEATLICIDDMGEDNFPGIFLSESKSHGHARAFRKGFNTTNRKKLEGCSKMKSMIESKRMQIRSKALVRELKFFVAKGNTYQAKPGESDDLVMSVMLIVRMLQELSSWDDEITEMMSDFAGEADYLEPMPTMLL